MMEEMSMKIRNIMTIAAVAAMLCACQFRDELIDLHSQIASEEDVTINSIQAQIDAIKETIPDLEQLKADLDEYLTDLEGKETELSDAIESSNSELDLLKTDAAADIDGSYGILDAEITSYISNIEGQLDLVRNEIERLEAEDQKLSDKIAELKEYVNQQISDTYDWAEQTFMTLEQYNSLCEYITTVETDLKSANDRMESLADDVTNQFETVFPTAMANMETELKSKISAIGETVAPAVQSVVEELTASYEALFAEEFGKYEAKMKTWINEQLSGYYTMAETDARISNLAKNLDTKLKSQKDYVFSLIAALYEEINQSVAENKEEITNLRTALGDINPAYTQNISDLAGLADRISANSENIAKNARDITAQDGKIDELDGLIDQNKELIDKNDEDIDALDVALAALNSRVGQLKETQQRQAETVASNARAIAANARLIQDNVTIMNSCAEAISQNASALVGIKTSINSMSNELKSGYDAAIEEAITRLEGKFNSAISDSLAMLNGKVDQLGLKAYNAWGRLQDSLSVIESEVVSVRTTLGSIKTSVSTIGTNVDKLLARIQSVTWVPADGNNAIAVDYLYGREASATATVNYRILPDGIAEQLDASVLKVFMLSGAAASAETEVDILSISAADDVLSVVVDAASLPAAFFAGSATAYMSMMVTDGNNERQSTYVPVTAAPRDADLVIPDSMFKAYLLYEFDMNADGKMTLKDSVLFHQAYEAADVSFTLPSLGIASLEGLQYFPDIKGLYITDNSLTALDLSGNHSLKTIYCSGCPIAACPDFSQCPGLEVLDCSNNEYSTLDLSGFAKLKEVHLSGQFDATATGYQATRRGKIETLTISDCPLLTEIEANYNKISSFSVTNCPQLSELYLISNYLDTFNGTYPSLTELYLDGNNVNKVYLENAPLLTEMRFTECRNLNFIYGNENLEEIDLTDQKTAGYYGENEHNTKSVSTVWIADCTNLKNIIIPDSSSNVIVFSGAYTEAITSNILNPGFSVMMSEAPTTFYVKDYEEASVDMAGVLTGISTIDFTQSPNITQILVPEGYSNTIVANKGVEIINY